MYTISVFNGFKEIPVVGKSKEEVHKIIKRDFRPFDKSGTGSYAENYDEFNVHYDSDNICKCIEVMTRSKLLYKNEKVSGLTEHELVNLFKKLEPQAEPLCDEYGVTYPTLALSFMFYNNRKTCNYVLVGKKGYYDFLINS